MHVLSLRLQDEVTAVPGEGVSDVQETVDCQVYGFRVA